jgi:hypothetical protein
VIPGSGYPELIYDETMKMKFLIRVYGQATLVALMCCVVLGSQGYGKTYVKGTVSLANKPVRSVWVIVSQSGQEKGRSLTGDDGKYYVANLSAGPYEIFVIQGKQEIYRSQVSLPANSVYNIGIIPVKARR